MTHTGSSTDQAAVLVLDFGSQYTQLIARRIRELNVYSEIKPCTAPCTSSSIPYKAIILSGGPASVTDSDAPKFDKRWLELGVPLLGICYGMQLLSHLGGGKLSSGASREYGFAALEITNAEDLFAGFDLSEKTTVWMSHGDHVVATPPGFRVLAKSSGAPIAAMGDQAKKVYALQFHPEVFHTPRGKDIIGNFLFKISDCDPSWTSEGFIERTVASIRDSVPPKARAICALSGGVDSTVAAVVVSRALGDRLHCIFVDNGLLRKHEADQVMSSLATLGLNVKKADAGALFLKGLKGVTDPEEKRRIIGRTFIEVFDKESKSLDGVEYLVQGTLYPDVIESHSTRGPSVTIKTHHNVGGLPEHMKLKLIEPFRELFKDEVRALGRLLEVPEQILGRQPFPGPGLAVRLLGEVNEERLAMLRDADHILQEEALAEGVLPTLWQCFAVLLPVRSVGVMGDGRTYEETMAIRAVHSEDAMTADWAYLPHELLRRVSSRIINEVKGINRVVLDISSKPPATIEWE